jgi:hypothetical protein
VRGCTDGLYTGILGAVVGTGDNNVAVKLAADFNTIFFDSGLGANLHTAVFKDFDQISYGYFFQHIISLFPATASIVALRLVGRTSTVKTRLDCQAFDLKQQ